MSQPLYFPFTSLLVAWESRTGWPRSLGSFTHVGDQEEAPGFCIWPGLTLVGVLTWGGSLSVSVNLPFKRINFFEKKKSGQVTQVTQVHPISIPRRTIAAVKRIHLSLDGWQGLPLIHQFLEPGSPELLSFQLVWFFQIPLPISWFCNAFKTSNGLGYLYTKISKVCPANGKSSSGCSCCSFSTFFTY